MIFHFVATPLPGHKPLADAATAWWLMGRLRAAFPDALAACLMPDHPHLIAPCDDPRVARVRLARVLGMLAVRKRARRLFEEVPEPRLIPDSKHLARQIRYVHLNPCRNGLVSDPLSWPWSTHRGLVGAEVDPWVTPGRLAAALGRSEAGFSEWLHRYVSGDPAVRVEGTRYPTTADPSAAPRVPLESVWRAALAATPWSPAQHRRQIFAGLAMHQGWRQTQLLAEIIGVSPRSVRRLTAAARRETAERAATLCLGDSRLALPDTLIRALR